MRLKTDKARVFIEIFPSISGDTVREANTVYTVPISSFGQTNKYSSALKPNNGGVHPMEAYCVCLAFDILPQDFFLWDSEGLENFLNGSIKPESLYFFRHPIEATSEQNDGGQEQCYFGVKITLLPKPKTEQETKRGDNIVCGYLQKAKDFCKRLKHKLIVKQTPDGSKQ